MSENWAAIAAAAASAIASVGFKVTITRPGPGPQTPWATDMQMTETLTATAVDMGIRRSRAGPEVTMARVLLVAAGDTAPQIGDTVEVRGQAHAVLAVMPTAPGGVDLMIKVELRI